MEPDIYALSKAGFSKERIEEITRCEDKEIQIRMLRKYRYRHLVVQCAVRVSDFCNAAPEEKDYSVLASFAPQRAMGKCVYCNHCQPCPAGLDVGLINKYYDLARSGDELARNHYENLAVKAESCVRCGHCDSQCPFHVIQMARMQEIAGYFNC